MRFTLDEIARFCLAHKGKRTLIDYTYAQIASTIIDAANCECLHTVYDDSGLCGVCIAIDRISDKTIHIHEIICIRNGFASFIVACNQKFPGYTITGYRRNKLKQFTKDDLWVEVIRRA